jgi:hypothetical protein
MAVYSISETKRAKDLNLRKYLEFLIKSRHNKNMSGKELKQFMSSFETSQDQFINKSITYTLW